ncbi:hypothetical protein BJY01DRAFT_246967 [Aspergillus pseudoustus]|uniref:Uncharacterized protein n=1 Tax=Aspergillus pseudoustus TaxID=1810923 RepID=A0ABR4K4E2_9EURO
MGPNESSELPPHTPQAAARTSKSLLFAIWIVALSLLTMAACTIYIAVLSQSLVDTSEKHLAAIGNNTRAIFAALADDSLQYRGLNYGTSGSRNFMSLRSNLDLLRSDLST